MLQYNSEQTSIKPPDILNSDFKRVRVRVAGMWHCTGKWVIMGAYEQIMDCTGTLLVDM